MRQARGAPVPKYTAVLVANGQVRHHPEDVERQLGIAERQLDRYA